jgi:hypothetical protein
MDPTILLSPSTTMSSHDSNRDAETIQDCAECGALATAEVLGDDGAMYSLCGVCDAHFREALSQLESRRDGLYSDDYSAVRMCEDCNEKAATREFCHMRKGNFFLCAHCFAWADHEDDYLEYCECTLPVGDPADTECLGCRRSLRPTTTYCECPTPTVVGSCRIECRECCHRIRYT